MISGAGVGHNRSIRLSEVNDEFLKSIYVSTDKRYTSGYGPKINLCLDLLRERKELAQMLCSGPDYDIAFSEMDDAERDDFFALEDYDASNGY